MSYTGSTISSARNTLARNQTDGHNAVRDLVDADRELALLRELIQASSSGPGVEPLAAAAARMITAATGTDVCVVHVLDDTDRSLDAGRRHASVRQPGR